MDKTIVTAFLIIAGVVSAVLLFNTVLPALTRSSDAISARERSIDDRLKSQVEIIHATANGNLAMIWVKNIGTLSIRAFESCDLFFGPEGNFGRIPLEQHSAGTPYWEWQVENGGNWDPTTTLQITVTNGSLLSGRYFVKMVIPTGSSDETFFSD